MKGLTLLVIAACALTGCDRDSVSAADSSGVATNRQDVLSKALDRGVGAPAPGMPTRQTGALGGFVADAATATSNIVAESRAGSAEEGASQENSGADALQNVNGATAIAPTMVIRNGQAFIEVNNVDSAIFRIRRLTAQVGGYITNSSISGGRDQIRQATLELKIPALKYDEAVGSLSVIGKVETVNSTAQDVGEEFVDVTARMNNARRLEDRLITLLATRTGKLDEVLRVEHELARVREEIERYQGRLRYLSSRAAISTLTITVHEPVAILGNNPGENPISAALNRAWRNFVALFAGLIASLGVVLPLALIAFAGWMGYRRWKRR
jgi:VIT1/CCC1 family predicted Fe2+/Mn2+ transporter